MKSRHSLKWFRQICRASTQTSKWRRRRIQSARHTTVTWNAVSAASILHIFNMLVLGCSFGMHTAAIIPRSSLINIRVRRTVCTAAFSSFAAEKACAIFPHSAGDKTTFETRLYLSSKSRTENDKHLYERDKLRLLIPTPEDMEDVGSLLSIGTGPGDVILLGGDLGAGKTVFSRGFVRARTGVGDMRVTSPTYLLSNTYEVDNGMHEIRHMDLYRLSEDGDFSPLDLDNVFNNCMSLIEWPSRLGRNLPKERLEVTFRIDIENDDGNDEIRCRYLTLEPHGDIWRRRLKMLEDEGYIDDLIYKES